MSIRRLNMALAILAGLAMLPMQAKASYTIYNASDQATPQTTVTMAQLNSGYSIVVDDKLFSGFTDTYSSVAIVGSPTTIAASSIIVTPLDANPLNPGLEYQGPFSVLPGQELDTAWSYTVSTLNGKPTIEDSSLSLGGTQFSPPVSSISVGKPSAMAAAPARAGSTYVINAPPETGNTMDIKFYQPVSTVYVSKDILLSAVGSSGDSLSTPTGFTTMIQRFSETPEPSTLAIAGLARWV